MKCQCIGQCSGLNPSGRMNNQTPWLVYNCECRVFKHYVEWNVFRSKVRTRRNQICFDKVVCPQLIRSLGIFTANKNLAILDQFLQSRTAPTLDMVGQKCIQSYTSFIFCNSKCEGSNVGRR